MLRTEINNTEAARILTFEGDLTIEHADEIWRTFCDTLDDRKSVSLNLEKVTGADASGLQLICAAHRACEAEGRVFVFDANVSRSFAAAARNAGFVRYNCGVAKDTTICLWRGIEDE